MPYFFGANGYGFFSTAFTVNSNFKDLCPNWTIVSTLGFCHWGSCHGCTKINMQKKIIIG